MKRLIRLNNNIIGPSKKYPVPIPLDPAYYEGAIVYGDDNILRFSNGTEWLPFGTEVAELPEDTFIGTVDFGTMD